jgi:hypothetical protein
MNDSRGLLRPAILAAGIALAGGLIGHGFVRARASDRFVTVKGISERKVQADIAFWPIMLSAADNDLHAAQSRVDAQMEQVKAFLVKQELDASGFEVQSPSVSDAWTNQYQDRTKVATRFVVNQTLMVYSEKPQAVATASRKVGELVSAGMVLNSGQGPIFMFTRLNDIKPEMIAEATSAPARGRSSSRATRAAGSTASGRRARGSSRSSRAIRSPGPAKNPR